MKSCLAILAISTGVFAAGLSAQRTTVEPVAKTELPDTPQVFGRGVERYQVRPIAKGLYEPWALAFLPNGDILVNEQPGRLRIIRNGVLDPKPIAGMPEVTTKTVHSGLMDIAVHPRYAENKFIYFTYNKLVPGGPFEDIVWQGNKSGKGRPREAAVVTLGRAKFDGGGALTDVKDIFVSDAKSQGTSGSRIAFAKDGKIVMTVGMATRHLVGTAEDAQNPGSHGGKVLRLNDDGTVPTDNPFVGKAGYKPEIFAMGIRNSMGIFVHPDTGVIWETENGPMGGDELNIIEAGKNYGWPTVTYGMDYSGFQQQGISGATSNDRMRPEFTDPFTYWVPSPAVAGITVYTGDKFPTWKGNVFVGTMGSDNVGARMVQRIVLSPTGRPQTRSFLPMLYELKQRIRDVRQGPDGCIYVTTDESNGAVLKIEPAQ